MTAAQTAGTGNAVGLEPWQRGGERFYSRNMGAVGAGASDKLGAAVKQERNVTALDRGRDRLGAIGQAALIGVGKPQQNSRDVAGSERVVESAYE
jgi:hypothetical protein